MENVLNEYGIMNIQKVKANFWQKTTSMTKNKQTKKVKNEH